MKISDKITCDFAKKIFQEEGLVLVGGGGSMMYNVKEISLSFECSKQVSIEEARALYVKVMESYLYNINVNESIRPYLDNYPFTWENIRLSISFHDEHHQFYTESVAAVFYVNGKGIIAYEGSQNDNLHTIHRETQEEALKAAGWCQ